jgi:hypothetical protein
MALEALLCSGDNELPQHQSVSEHQSVLRAIHTLNTPKIYLRLLSKPSPIKWRCWSKAQGLMWGTRGPFLPGAVMVGYGCVGCCWPLRNIARNNARLPAVGLLIFPDSANTLASRSSGLKRAMDHHIAAQLPPPKK